MLYTLHYMSNNSARQASVHAPSPDSPLWLVYALLSAVPGQYATSLTHTAKHALQVAQTQQDVLQTTWLTLFQVSLPPLRFFFPLEFPLLGAQ